MVSTASLKSNGFFKFLRVFVIIGILMCGFGIFKLILEIHKVKSFSVTEGIVIGNYSETDHRVKTHRITDWEDRYEDVTLFAPIYEYFVNGNRYEYSPRGILSGERAIANNKVTILYNPEKPEDAIVKGRYESMSIVFGGGIFFIIGIGLIFMFYIIPEILKKYQ